MELNRSAVFSIAYLPPIEYYYRLLEYDEVEIEFYEHFVKQTYRNRCNIYGTNGKLTLTIPLEKRSERTLTKDIRISYSDNWQKNHWRSIESAYRCSPFFEFYEDDFAPFYKKEKCTFLFDFNEKMFETVNSLIKTNTRIKKTKSYEKIVSSSDYRNIIEPKKSETPILIPYKQVFDSKYGFIPNLSIIDLLFNHGPSSKDYLK